MVEIDLRIRRIRSLWDHIENGAVTQYRRRVSVRFARFADGEVFESTTEDRGPTITVTIPDTLNDGSNFAMFIHELGEPNPLFASGSLSVEDGIIFGWSNGPKTHITGFEVFVIDDLTEARQMLIKDCLDAGAEQAATILAIAERHPRRLYDRGFWFNELIDIAEVIAAADDAGWSNIDNEHYADKFETAYVQSLHMIPRGVSFEIAIRQRDRDRLYGTLAVEWEFTSPSMQSDMTAFNFRRPGARLVSGARRTLVGQTLRDQFDQRLPQFSAADLTDLTAFMTELIAAEAFASFEYLGSGVNATTAQIANEVTAELEHPALHDRIFVTNQCRRPMLRGHFFRAIEPVRWPATREPSERLRRRVR